MNSDAEVCREVQNIKHEQNEDIEDDTNGVELGEIYLKSSRFKGEQSKAGTFW